MRTPTTDFPPELWHEVKSRHGSLRLDDYSEGSIFHYVHLKRDGYCILAHKRKGELHCYTRTPLRVYSGQAWYTELQDRLPEGEWLFGELFVPGGVSQDVRSVLAANPKREGAFEVFYVPSVNSFSDCEVYCQRLGLTMIGLSQHCSLSNVPEGYEGYVLKCDYHPKDQLNHWMKLKPSPSIDLRIVGIETAVEGRHIGSVKCFLCETDDKLITVKVGVMTDDVREHAKQFPNAWIGKVVEVAYQHKTSLGSLRHPRLVRVRNDKSSTS